MEPSRKPLNLLIRKMNGDVAVKLKNDTEYRGKMIDCDSHIVRGSNVLYICVSQPTP